METQKKVIFAFRGDPLCFIHVLLNGIDLYERGQEGLIVIEGDAVTLVPEMAKSDHFLFTLYQKAKGLDHEESIWNYAGHDRPVSHVMLRLRRGHHGVRQYHGHYR
jgi:hypothetical protein